MGYDYEAEREARRKVYEAEREAELKEAAEQRVKHANKASKVALFAFAAVIAAGPVVTFLIWAFEALLLPGMGGWRLGLHQQVRVWLTAGGFLGTAVRNIWIVMLAVAGFITIACLDAERSNTDSVKTALYKWTLGVIAGVSAVLLVLGVTGYSRAVWNDDKQVGDFYGSATQFVVPSLHDVPSAVAQLVTSSNPKGTHGCTLTGPKGDDVRTCITVGDYPAGGWLPRVSSADGAKYRMKRMSGNVSGTNVDQDSLTYLNTDAGGAWSAIRDGSGRTVPMDGIISWDGTNDPAECKFAGPNKLNRAIHGSRGNSLPNLLNDRYRTLQFDYSEAWGYCDGNTPVVVFPVKTQQAFHHRLMNVPAGVVIMHGSKSGDPVTEYKANIAAGTLPGPVYPSSTVDQQVDATSWAGGRRMRSQQKFGFEPTTSSAQAGNVDDYLLQSKQDGRMYWVTPLTPKHSDTQTFVAYSVTAADEVHAGSLNTQKVYVVPDNDKMLTVNVDQLASDAKNYVSQVQPGFIAAGGKIIEFIPQENGLWRGYGEIGGQVEYRLDIDPTGKISPELVAIDPATGAEQTDSPVTGTSSVGGQQHGTANGPDCNNPTALSATQIAQCISILSDALQAKVNPPTAGTSK